LPQSEPGRKVWNDAPKDDGNAEAILPHYSAKYSEQCKSRYDFTEKTAKNAKNAKNAKVYWRKIQADPRNPRLFSVNSNRQFAASLFRHT